jgi:hypothetical protein
VNFTLAKRLSYFMNAVYFDQNIRIDILQKFEQNTRKSAIIYKFLIIVIQLTAKFKLIKMYHLTK